MDLQQQTVRRLDFNVNADHCFPSAPHCYGFQFSGVRFDKHPGLSQLVLFSFIKI